jgi:hypothetical protein
MIVKNLLLLLVVGLSTLERATSKIYFGEIMG